jgi:hypothetical protein
VYSNTHASQHSPSKEDSYSASLRLASLESLTGRAAQFLGRPPAASPPSPHRDAADYAGEAGRFSHASMPTSSSTAATSGIKVPTSNDSSAMALANFGLLGLPLGHLLGGGPAGPSLAHLLGGQAGSSGGLPRPADLIQQAQALQLLAHLQTVLMQAGGAGHPAGPGHPVGPGHPAGVGHHPYQSSGAGQPRHSPNLFSPDMQKVC